MSIRFRVVLILQALVFLPMIWVYRGEGSRSYQAPGYADITWPSGGEAVFGIVTIEGSASHPAFVSYDLSFAYPEDPTNTWFLIGETTTAPVENGVLGIWDTSGITDGEYRLRLRVNLDNEVIIEHLVDNVRIRNRSAIETATPITSTSLVSPTSPAPTNTPRPTPIPLTVEDRVNPAGQIFIVSFGLGAVLLLLIGIYLHTRQRLRSHWSKVQMRRVLRQNNRSGRGARRR